MVDNELTEQEALEALVVPYSYDGTSLGEIIQHSDVQTVSGGIVAGTLDLSPGTLYRMRKIEQKKLRKEAARLRRKRKQHYMTQRKRKRIWERENRLPQEREYRFFRRLTPEGSYEALLESRRNMGVSVEITLEGWSDIYTQYGLKDYNYKVLAYDTTASSITAYSIYVVDCDSSKVLYDGIEVYLSLKGYIL